MTAPKSKRARIAAAPDLARRLEEAETIIKDFVEFVREEKPPISDCMFSELVEASEKFLLESLKGEEK